jgi:hypothetical protein
VVRLPVMSQNHSLRAVDPRFSTFPITVSDPQLGQFDPQFAQLDVDAAALRMHRSSSFQHRHLPIAGCLAGLPEQQYGDIRQLV